MPSLFPLVLSALFVPFAPVATAVSQQSAAVVQAAAGKSVKTSAPAASKSGSASTVTQPVALPIKVPQPILVPIKPASVTDTPPDTALSVPLKITLTPSETPLKLGSTSNIAGDIANASNKPVEIDTSSIQLMTHAILSQTDTLCVLPISPVSNTNTIGLVVLQPQDHINVLFNLSQRKPYANEQEDTAINEYFELQRARPGVASASNTSATPDPNAEKLALIEAKYRKANQEVYDRSCDPNFLGPVKRALDFSPGNYEYFLSGKYSVCDPADPYGCPFPGRFFSQSATFQVGIDQTQIIIFAVLGGLLAYLVVSVRSDDGAFNEFFRRFSRQAEEANPARPTIVLFLMILRDMVGVAILSAAFTIVSSRLADTQFPIKISVLDAWGAMTIGFLSYFLGNKFIDSLRAMVR